MLRFKALARSAYAVWATRAAALLCIVSITSGLPAGQSPADTSEPTARITSPWQDATVSGMVTITVEVYDASPVAGVAFEVDGAVVGVEDVEAPWSYAWDASASGSGSHILTVVARDAAGNAARSDTVPVVVAAVVSPPPNRSPVAVGDWLASVGRVPVTFTGASLLANDSDADGQTLRITAVASASAGGGSISGTTSSDSYQYTPAATFSGVDTFSYSIADTAGGAASAVVSVNVTAPVVITVPVPVVVPGTEAAARLAIVGAGLTVSATNANHATVPAGNVISQTPLGGMSVPVGSTVALVVSLGPAAAPGGLVAAFGFEEATGLTVINSSNPAVNGTIRGALRQAGKFGNALFFDGVNDWVTVTDGMAGHPLDLTTGMTLEAWVNPAELRGWETAVLKERGAGLLSYALYAHDGAPEGSGFAAPAGYVRAAGADQPVRDALALPLGTWTHIATTYDGANERLYVNGVLAATRAQTGAIAVGNGALRIGGNNAFTGEFFRGLIDEVRIYNRALSAAEIGAAMNTPVVP